MTKPSLSAEAFAQRRLERRNAAERRFKLYGQIAIGIAVGFLALLLISICGKVSFHAIVSQNYVHNHFQDCVLIG